MVICSKSSQCWFKEYFFDFFVKKVQVEGMCLCVVYKFEELLECDWLLKFYMVVVDFGVVLGGWFQQVWRQIGDIGCVLVLDILDMLLLVGVEFFYGDFREEVVLLQFEVMFGDQLVDFVLLDMVFNKSGVGVVDQSWMMYLVELVLDFVDNYLKIGGVFLIKLFQGEGFDDYVCDMCCWYDKVFICKLEVL